MTSTGISRITTVVAPLLCFFSGLFLFPSCEKMGLSSSQKAITSFILKHSDGTSFRTGDINVTISADTITVLVLLPPIYPNSFHKYRSRAYPSARRPAWLRISMPL
jgi:hypothetical protein